MNQTNNNVTLNDNTTILLLKNDSSINDKDNLKKFAQFYGKISSIVISIITILIVFVCYYISQKKKEATYYGVEDKLDKNFFAKNPKFIKQKEEMEICHVQNDSNMSLKKSGNNNFEGSIKIVQIKHPTSVVIHSKTIIDEGCLPLKKGRRIVLLSNEDVQTKIEAIIELDNIKNGREVLESVQRRISDKIQKMSNNSKKNCYISKICGIIAMDTRHSLEQLSEDLWVVYGSKDDNTFVTSGLHNIFENANSMSLCLRVQIILPVKCKLLAFKIDRNVS